MNNVAGSRLISKGIFYFFAVYLGCIVGLLAQSFQNLNFESASLTPIPTGQYGDYVPITNALPHWTAYIGTNQVTQVLQNNMTLGDASIDIFGPQWFTNQIIQGRYTLELQSG